MPNDVMAEVERALFILWHHITPTSPEEGKAVAVLRSAFPALPVPRTNAPGVIARACLVSVADVVPLLRSRVAPTPVSAVPSQAVRSEDAP